jgi:hypothetical protein
MLQALTLEPLKVKREQKARGQLDEARRMEHGEEIPRWREKALEVRAKSAASPPIRGTAGQMPRGHCPLARLKKDAEAWLMALHQQKEDIRQQKDQLDVDERDVDEQIAIIKEEFRRAVEEEEHVAVKKEEEDVEGEEEEEEEKEDVAVKKEEVKDVEFDYARRWQAQGGDDSGIPKEYTPCKFFFKARDSCQMSKCLFSHNTDIFCQEPFASILQNLSWERKAKTKTFPRPPPYPPPPLPPKKHRRVKRDEEDLPKVVAKKMPRGAMKIATAEVKKK